MLKKFIFLLFAILLLAPIISQTFLLKTAQAIIPITSPVTSPTPTTTATPTPTLTPAPTTTPVELFNLVGNITYKNLGKLKNNMPRFFPADGVIIKVKGFFDSSKKYTTTTDGDGNYKLSLPEGLYIVEPKDSDSTFFAPPLKVVKIKGNKEHRANFQGLIFPH